MEEEWKTFLRENDPELYIKMEESIAWEVKWRDRRIFELELEIGDLQNREASDMEHDCQFHTCPSDCSRRLPPIEGNKFCQYDGVPTTCREPEARINFVEARLEQALLERDTFEKGWRDQMCRTNEAEDRVKELEKQMRKEGELDHVEVDHG